MHTRSHLTIAAALSACVLTLAAVPLAAQQALKIDLANETVGAEPKSLLSVVGIWRIEQEGGKNVIVVDGRKWKEGQSSAGVADKARALYGERGLWVRPAAMFNEDMVIDGVRQPRFRREPD